MPAKREKHSSVENQTASKAAREKCHILYEGKRTGHRSCGIAIAETFGLPTQSYQALRKGGLTGNGPCGAIQAGRLVLGELLGDPDPTGPTTPALLEAITRYDQGWPQTSTFKESTEEQPNVVCNHLTRHFPIFKSAERHAMCTGLASDVATLVADVLLEGNHPVAISPIEGVDDFDPDEPNSV